MNFVAVDIVPCSDLVYSDFQVCICYIQSPLFVSDCLYICDWLKDPVGDDEIKAVRSFVIVN